MNKKYELAETVIEGAWSDEALFVNKKDAYLQAVEAIAVTISKSSEDNSKMNDVPLKEAIKLAKKQVDVLKALKTLPLKFSETKPFDSKRTSLYSYLGETFKFNAEIITDVSDKADPYKYSCEYKYKKQNRTEQPEFNVLEIKLSHDGKLLSPIFITNEKLINRLIKYQKTNRQLEFLASVVELKVSRSTSKRFLLIHKVRTLKSAASLIHLTKEEKEKTKKLIKELVKQERGVSKYIKEQLVKILDIKNMEGIPELSKALDFTITQSFAGDYGKIGNTPPKLHSLIIGPPAIGKKLLIGAARILNPVFRESQSAKQTLSGLSASTQYKNGSMVSVKGVLPQANMGVAVIQDFHNKNTAQSYQIMDLLGTVMEEGHVLDSTSANTEHIARTSIHLDTNLRSDLYGVEEPNLIANMGNIPTNVISRLDFITFIERDTERQCMTASKMYETKKDTLNDTEKTKIKRELKCLVAYLRTKHKKVELKTVEAYMQKKFNLFWEKNKNQMEKLNIVSDQLPRSTNSIKKMVSAEARANNRLSAMKADVNVAFDFMSEKFKFLQKLVPAMRLANSWSMDSEKRRSWIRKKFAGVKFTIQELLNEYEKDYPQEYAKKEEEAHTRTFYRDLGKVAQKAEHGKYTIGQ